MGEQAGSSGAMAYQAGDGLAASAYEIYELIEEVGDERTPPGWRQYRSAGGRSPSSDDDPWTPEKRTPHP